MSRREFPRKIRAQIILRATNAKGQLVCEGCGLVLGKKRYEVDHTVPEALVMDKTAPLTAEDGKLLGYECCHAPKTGEDVRRIRKADRQRDSLSGAKKPKWPAMPGTKRSGIRRRMNGVVERW